MKNKKGIYFYLAGVFIILAFGISFSLKLHLLAHETAISNLELNSFGPCTPS